MLLYSLYLALHAILSIAVSPNSHLSELCSVSTSDLLHSEREKLLLELSKLGLEVPLGL